MRDHEYRTVIERGRSPINDAIHDFLIPRISGHWLDIGCNTGWMLSDLPNGVGVEPSLYLVELARAKGLDVRHAWAEELPFPDSTFETALTSCVLEICEDWRRALSEARRVARRVIGLVPYPGSDWGVIGGRGKWIRHVIDPNEFLKLGGSVAHHVIPGSLYYFEVSQ